MAISDEELIEIVSPDGTIKLDPNRKYTPGELDQITTMVLRRDAKNGNHIKGKNPILFEEHIKNRHRREIFNKEGVPDPAFGQGQFNRTHPQGRKVNSEEQRKKNGAAFYRIYSFLSVNEYLMGKEMLESRSNEFYLGKKSPTRQNW